MPTITAIKPQKRKERYNIYIDGKFGFGLDAETLVKSGLKVGQEISPEKVGILQRCNELNKLYEKALKFLSYRPRSEREVRDHLRRKILNFKFLILNSESHEGSIQSVTETIVERLKKCGYIDDEAFSRWWVKQRREHRPRGKILLYQELRQKGISQEIVESVLNRKAITEGTEGTEGTEIELATKAAQKKLGAYKNLTSREFKQKMGQFLARRGFEWEVIKETVDNLLSKR